MTDNQALRSMEAEEIRRRYAAELMSSGGLTSNRLSLEVLYLLPSEFVTGYVSLFYRALKDPTGIQRQESIERATVKGGEGLGSKAKGGKKHKIYWTVKDERALDLKGAIDKALMELSGDMQPGGQVATKRCAGSSCGRFLKPRWRFCPWCGTPGNIRRERWEGKKE